MGGGGGRKKLKKKKWGGGGGANFFFFKSNFWENCTYLAFAMENVVRVALIPAVVTDHHEEVLRVCVNPLGRKIDYFQFLKKKNLND